jgi:hypothetical protein
MSSTCECPLRRNRHDFDDGKLHSQCNCGEGLVVAFAHGLCADGTREVLGMNMPSGPYSFMTCLVLEALRAASYFIRVSVMAALSSATADILVSDRVLACEWDIFDKCCSVFGRSDTIDVLSRNQVAR